MLAPLTICLLGFANGVRHAFEPDHLAAVSSLVAEQPSSRASVRYAAAWGAGHAAMLVLVGGALAVMERRLSQTASDALELAVAVVLVLLGVRGLRHAVRHGRSGAGQSRVFAHEHRDVAHAHAGPVDHVHVRSLTLARLPFAVGLVHGLAGSGAMAALVASRVSSPIFGVSFIAIYALGAAAGMSALAGMLGWPLAKLSRSGRATQLVVAASAFASLAVGVAWAAPILARALGAAS